MTYTHILLCAKPLSDAVFGAYCRHEHRAALPEQILFQPAKVGCGLCLFLLSLSSTFSLSLFKQIPIVFGVALATFGDMRYTAIGIFFTVCCVILAALKVVLSGQVLSLSLSFSFFTHYLFIMLSDAYWRPEAASCGPDLQNGSAGFGSAFAPFLPHGRA